MNKRIKELAEQSGLVRFKFGEQRGYTTIEAVPNLNNLERFAELIRADEREAIIDICEGVEVFDETMRTITEAIRQRGEK